MYIYSNKRSKLLKKVKFKILFCGFIYMYVLMSCRKPKFEAVLSPPRCSEGHRRRTAGEISSRSSGAEAAVCSASAAGTGARPSPVSQRTGPARSRVSARRVPPAESGPMAPLRHHCACQGTRVTARVCPAPLALLGPGKRLLRYPGPGPGLRAPRPLACAPRGRERVERARARAKQ